MKYQQNSLNQINSVLAISIVEPGIFWSVVRRVIHCATGPTTLAPFLNEEDAKVNLSKGSLYRWNGQLLPFLVVQTQNLYHSNVKDTVNLLPKITNDHQSVMLSDLAELSCEVLRRPVSSVGRAWDSYIANQKCSRYPRVVGSSPTSGELFIFLKNFFQQIIRYLMKTVPAK